MIINLEGIISQVSGSADDNNNHHPDKTIAHPWYFYKQKLTVCLKILKHKNLMDDSSHRGRIPSL